MILRCMKQLCIEFVRPKSSKQKLHDYVFPVIQSKDCVQKVASGWGPGGQNVNMTRNAVLIKHIPTGVVVRVHQSRLLHENIKIAQERLKHAVDRYLNHENSYDAQFRRLERERIAKNKRKRALTRDYKKMLQCTNFNCQKEDCTSSQSSFK
ncbi:unnamed protein product [Thelazia callipaeda]|uniref:RF_PROK_I domain-containing protein n=1 Tax=Thelazia callipaeda TaxID=103827 RepID=A0A0N5CK16_THECL|nr:unnamed protein product [Thelazia callipaeda]